MALKFLLFAVIIAMVIAAFGYVTPNINYSSQQVFCLEAACISGTGFDKQCLESQPRLAQMHVVETGSSQRVVFEMTTKLCKENDGLSSNWH